MGFVTSLAEKRHTQNYEGWLATLKEPGSWMQDWFGAGETTSGVRVNQSTALGLTAYYAGIRILAESVAQLPLNVFERKGSGRVRVDSHPLSYLLHSQPNSDMTSFGWREAKTGHLISWGNCYSRIDRDRSGGIRGIVPLRPDRTHARKNKKGERVYAHQIPGGKTEVLLPHEVFHVHGLGFDGISGYSPVAIHANTIGRGLALGEYAARFFKNDARPSGFRTQTGALASRLFCITRPGAYSYLWRGGCVSLGIGDGRSREYPRMPGGRACR